MPSTAPHGALLSLFFVAGCASASVPPPPRNQPSTPSPPATVVPMFKSDVPIAQGLRLERSQVVARDIAGNAMDHRSGPRREAVSHRHFALACRSR
ncbi:MAG: hypothetical protein R3B72_03810 [Polyangiaceae bacterium]